MPAITVLSAKIAKQGSTQVATLRVVVDRSLASVGGPGAGIVASGAVTQDAATMTLPQLTLYSTWNAADLITKEAIYRAELLDGSGNVVEVLNGFGAFQIRVISTQTTWNEIREQNDFYSLIQGAGNTRLGNDSTPSLGNSVVTVLGAITNAPSDTINLFFGSQVNPPGIRRNIATAQMEFSHDGQTWTAMGSGGGGGGNVSGSGTVNYLPIWTSGTTLGNSPLFYDLISTTTTVTGSLLTTENAAFGYDQVLINSNPVRATNVPLLTLKNVLGQTAPVIRIDDTANGNAFRSILMPDGNLRPRGVITVWPVANAAGVLTNDGAGNLSWAAPAGTYSWLIQADSGLAAPVPNAQAVQFAGGAGITTSRSLFVMTIDVDLLSTGGLQTSGGGAQLGIKLDTVTGGGNNVAVLSANGLYVPPGGGGGGGTVTSVGLSLPGVFSISGSPVTSSGTLTAALVNQNANLVFAGPGSGGPAVPTFRALVANDYVTMVGDSGAGGVKGAVPAPAAGDAAANKFLKADGTWSAVTTGGSIFYQGNSGGVGTYIIGAPGEVLTIDGGAGLSSTTIPGSDTIRIDVDLAPIQSGVPNIASIVSNQLYVTPRQYVRTRAVSANDAIICATDNVLLVSTTGGNIAITLTTPIAGEFRDFYIKKTTTDGNTITLTPASGQIDGGASFVFSGTIGTAGEGVHVVFDGTNWWVISRT
jgi:hypothetical protein